MLKNHGAFTFKLVSPSPGDYPFTPFVQIGLDDFMTAEDGSPLLSAHLVTEAEIDERIDDLKASLERVCNMAKQALRLAKPGT